MLNSIISVQKRYHILLFHLKKVKNCNLLKWNSLFGPPDFVFAVANPLKFEIDPQGSI